MSVSDASELMSDSLSGDDLSGMDLSDSSSESECFEHIRSSCSIDSTGVPLYPDSCNNGFSTMFLSLMQRHNLTYASQSDLLNYSAPKQRCPKFQLRVTYLIVDPRVRQKYRCIALE